MEDLREIEEDFMKFERLIVRFYEFGWAGGGQMLDESPKTCPNLKKVVNLLQQGRF